MRSPGDILLVSTYELGHAPHGVALPKAFLERAGFAPATLDLAVEPLDPAIVTLIPKWDAWTMGYAPDGRDRIADAAHLPLAYSTTETSHNKASGDAWPLVLRGGRAVARWESRYVANRLEVTIMPFPGESIAEAEIRSGFEKIAVFLGCSEVAIGLAEAGHQG